MHDVIDRTGRGAYYIFDCLSYLADEWHSDAMLGNFFVLDLPVPLRPGDADLFRAAARPARRGRARSDSRDDPQIFLDVYDHGGGTYVRPLKTQHRYSPTISMLHTWEGEHFEPVASSAVAAEVLTSAGREGAAADAGRAAPAPTSEFERLARAVFTREEGIAPLLRRYLTLDDILEVRRRMIGTGLRRRQGRRHARSRGRSCGETRPRLSELLEPHDSFFIGSDVFYTYLVQNGIWWLRQRQSHPDLFLRRGRARPGAASSAASFPTTSCSRFARHARLLRPVAVHRPVQLACWKTTSATPSPASTTASSAPTRARTRSGWRTSSPPCARSTPAR